MVMLLNNNQSKFPSFLLETVSVIWGEFRCYFIQLICWFIISARRLIRNFIGHFLGSLDPLILLCKSQFVRDTQVHTTIARIVNTPSEYFSLLLI